MYKRIIEDMVKRDLKRVYICTNDGHEFDIVKMYECKEGIKFRVIGNGVESFEEVAHV